MTNADAQLAGADHGIVFGDRYSLATGVLRGKHNRQNQLAAILAARALGFSPARIQPGLDTFAGVEHRIERVREVGGVEYFNDSKATNDDAAAKALLSFAQPIVWLAGGKDKHGVATPPRIGCSWPREACDFVRRSGAAHRRRGEKRLYLRARGRSQSGGFFGHEKRKKR